jgi:N-acetylglucosaminyl-diphospho-decaprenol L-rhamnosyltransferase
MADVDIVIVNWNTGPLLARCIESLGRTDRNEVNVRSTCIVDNASTDGSLDLQAPSGVPLDILRNECNAGFAAACNQGAARGVSKYILFLNPDTELHDSSISAPIRFLEDPSNRQFVICGIQLVDHHGHPAACVSRFPSATAFLYKVTGLSELFKTACASVLLPAGEPSVSGEVDQIMGAFMLVRRHAFQELGGFDERFFVYFEDADLSLRAKRAGYGSYFLKDATAYHKGQGSSEKVKALRLFYSLRARLQYAHKHFGFGARGLTFIITVAVEPIVRALRSVGSSGSVQETFEGYWHLYKWLIRSSMSR